jgi:hypothetical protein
MAASPCTPGLPSFADLPADPRPGAPCSLPRAAVNLVRYGRDVVRRHTLLLRCAATGRELIFVFAHPRTGSTSVWRSLVGGPNFDSLHVHAVSRAHVRWQPETWPVAADGVLTFGAAPAWAVRTRLSIGPTRFVVTIRDPVAVNISFFLYWGRRFWVPAEWDRLDSLPDAEIARLFLTRYPHRSVLRWMAREFGPATGLAADTVRFDTARAAAVIRGDRASALVLRSDLDDARKNAELAAFLAADVPPVQQGNSIGERLGERQPLHDRVRRVVAGIPGYVDTLVDDPFTSWFWSAAERASMRHHWAEVARGPRDRDIHA